MMKLEELTDEHLENARRGYRNLLVAVGFMGGNCVMLNPKSAREVSYVAKGYYDDCSVKLVGFDDIFEAYDINPAN